jgi:hypothetical protein
MCTQTHTHTEERRRVKANNGDGTLVDGFTDALPESIEGWMEGRKERRWCLPTPSTSLLDDVALGESNGDE